MIDVAISRVRVGDTELKVCLTNGGRYEYLNVIFVISLPPGVMWLRGQRRISKSRLLPGETVCEKLRVRVDEPGRYPLTSPNFSYKDHNGKPHREPSFTAEIIVHPAPAPASGPTPEPRTGGSAGPGARPEWQWDVALSFAGARRDYVEQVSQALQARGVRCFYDADEQIDLWGKYLAEELPAIYGEQAAAVVVFVSAEYADRDWTRLERRAALARAVRERRDYVLPARFDDTPLPGLLSDMVTVDLRGRTPQQFADMVAVKLAALGITGPA